MTVPYGVYSFLNKGYILSVIEHTAVEHLSAFAARDVMHSAMFSSSLSVYIRISTGDTDIFA